MSDQVTVVIATYGRPATLACAVRSVLQQTMERWKLLVVGDACGAETQAAMAPFLADPRVAYVNLPWRCGEQAIPNSAGLACATTEWVALLNHDDLWLPHHLADASRQLRDTQADFYLARSAWIWRPPQRAGQLPPIDSLSPLWRDFFSVFAAGFHSVEPASAWVYRRQLVDRVGPWRSAAQLFRAPIQDWVLRAHRAGARFTLGQAVSCLKFEIQWLSDAPERRYDSSAAAQQAVLAALHDAAGRAQLQQQLVQLAQRPEAVGRGMQLSVAPLPHPELERLGALLVNRQSADNYLQTGLDVYTWLCAEAGLARGWRWRWALQQRTGETGVQPPAVEAVIAHVRRALTERCTPEVG